MFPRRAFAFTCLAIGLMPATAAAAQVCGTVADFNQAMADAGATSTDVTLTFDVLGVDPNDFFGTKGSLAQFRDTTCANGADIGIKVYGPDDPPNDAHPPARSRWSTATPAATGPAASTGPTPTRRRRSSSTAARPAP
jgi:hypothetical protein